MSPVERLWTYIYRDLYEEDDYRLIVYGTAIWMALVFYVGCGLLTFVDVTSKPSWIARYKTQPTSNKPLERTKLWKAVLVSTFNLVGIGFPYLIFLYHVRTYVGYSCQPENLPTAWEFVKDIMGIILIQEIAFYYFHRLAHWGPLYRAIHKQHHEWTAPIAIVCVYCHPVEHLVCNLMTFTAGPVIMRAHIFTTLFWYTGGTISTILMHSGYHFPFLMSPEDHDYHHLKFNNNYGSIGILDWLHGTDRHFRQAVQFKRHRALYGFTPMTEKYPDRQKSQ